jgi:hypothetical protein
MKDVGLRIRVQRELRDKFTEACRRSDKPAAQVLREFMRDYVAHQEPANDQPRQQPTRQTKEGKR